MTTHTARVLAADPQQTTLTDLREQLRAALSADGDQGTHEFFEYLARLSAATIDARDLAGVVRLREQLRRLARRATRDHQHLDARAPHLLAVLGVLDQTLDFSCTAAELREPVERRAAERKGLRGRIVAALRVAPRRPRQLADDLGTGPTQVSRVLKQLVAEGVVTRVAAPDAHSDARAHWYGLANVAPSPTHHRYSPTFTGAPD